MILEASAGAFQFCFLELHENISYFDITINPALNTITSTSWGN